MPDESGDLGALKLGLVAYFNKVRPEIKGLKNDLTDLKKEAEKGGPAAERSFRGASDSALMLARSLENVTRILKLVGVGYLALKALRLGKELTGDIINVTADFEEFRITLGQLLKGDVNEFMDKLAEKAKKTSMSLKEYVSVAVGLVGVFGEGPEFDRALDLVADMSAGLKAIGVNADMAAGMLRKLKGGQFGEAFERLSEWGIDWRKILGVATPEDARKLGLDKVFETIVKGMEEKFGGLSEKTAGTFRGILSNLGDAWTQIKKKIGEAGFFDDIKGELDKVLAKVNEWFETGKVDDWAKAISGHLRGLFLLLTTAGKGLADLLGIDLTTPAKEATKPTAPTGPSWFGQEENRGIVEEYDEAGNVVRTYSADLAKMAEEQKNAEVAITEMKMSAEDLNEVLSGMSDEEGDRARFLETYNQMMNENAEVTKDVAEAAKEAEDNIPQGYKDIAAGMESIFSPSEGTLVSRFGDMLTSGFKDLNNNAEFKTALADVAGTIREILLTGLPTLGEMLARIALGNEGYEKVTNVGSKVGSWYSNFLTNTDYITAQRGIAINEVLFGDAKKGLNDLADINKAADEYKNATVDLINNTGNVLTNLVALTQAASERAKDVRKRLLKEPEWDNFTVNEDGTIGE